jgi:glycerophosphoryl diester phosphodiesterase
MTSVIAHRGASAVEAENTVAAFHRAVDMGADGIELDVRRTADDRLVVHHDAVLSGGRAIGATPSAELPDHVPELGAALDACTGAFVNIEIKNDPREPDFDPTDWVAHRLAAELGPRHPGSRWLISSFRFETVGVCRRIMPGVRTAWLVRGVDDERIEATAAAGHAAIHPRVEGLEAAHVRAAHDVGLAVNTWTCDDPGRIRELIGWGVDGICTNVPDVALAVRRGDAASGG